VNFDELSDDVYPSLYRYCLRLTADPDVAEDVTQEAFVRF
jgi:DNA-directed RNA polymerase specialized sigma24 family protein